MGALTSKPFSFRGRPWEMSSYTTFDFLDSCGMPIRVDVRDGEVMRVLPLIDVSYGRLKHWITDRIRFSYDGFALQRLESPFLKVDGISIPITWDKAFSHLVNFIEKEANLEVDVILGELIDSESVFYLRKFLNRLGAYQYFYFQNYLKRDILFRENYLFNYDFNAFCNIESKEEDVFILVGFQPRIEAPYVNMALRYFVMLKNVPIFYFGAAGNVNYKAFQLGTANFEFLKFVEGRHPVIPRLIKKNPSIILGSSCFEGSNAAVFEQIVKDIQKLMLKFCPQMTVNFIAPAISYTGILDNGVMGQEYPRQIQDRSRLVILCNADEANIVKKSAKDLTLYVGSHGERGAEQSDLIFPIRSVMEDQLHFVDMFGKVRKTSYIISNKKNTSGSDLFDYLEHRIFHEKRGERDEKASEDYRKFIAKLYKQYEYRQRKEKYPFIFSIIGFEDKIYSKFLQLSKFIKKSKKKTRKRLKNSAFIRKFSNSYVVNVITRSSVYLSIAAMTQHYITGYKDTVEYYPLAAKHMLNIYKPKK